MGLHGAHSVFGIYYQIQDYLLQLNPVSYHWREIACQVGKQLDPAPEHVAAYECDHLLNGLINIERRLFRRSLAQEIANPLNHFTRTHAIADHSPNNFARLIKIRHLARKQAHARMTVGDNSTEWLIDFMSYRSDQFAHSSHPTDMREIRLRFVQRFFSTLLLGNILAGDQDNWSVKSGHCFCCFANPEYFAVSTNFSGFPVPGPAEFFQAEGEISLDRLAI